VSYIIARGLAAKAGLRVEELKGGEGGGVLGISLMQLRHIAPSMWLHFIRDLFTPSMAPTRARRLIPPSQYQYQDWKIWLRSTHEKGLMVRRFEKVVPKEAIREDFPLCPSL
jgi:hypothetical protein